MKTIRLFLLTIFLVALTPTSADTINSVSKKASVVGKDQIRPKKHELGDSKYASYSVDGFTSASKLAAQRSHTVAGKDERNFAIFTGITTMLIIYFFTQFDFFDK